MFTPVKVQNFAQFENEYGSTTSGELADQVRQFFINGGATAYVCRVAHNADKAAITLKAEDGTSVLKLVARDPGELGNAIRARVDYDTADPERTFNLTLFRRVQKPDGTFGEDESEALSNLSMNPTSPDYVVTRVAAASALVSAEVIGAPGTKAGVSIAGYVLPKTEATVKTEIDALMAGGKNSIRIAIGDHPPVPVILQTTAGIVAPNEQNKIATRWTGDINGALAANSILDQVTVAITAATLAGGGIEDLRLLQITCATAAVRVLPANAADLTAGIGLGVGAGGIEGDTYGDRRPAPSGYVARNGSSADTWKALRSFCAQKRDKLTDFTLTDDSGDPAHTGVATIALVGGNVAMVDATTLSLANARGALDVVAKAINDNCNKRWAVKRMGNRLVLTPLYGSDNTGVAAGVALTTATVDLAAAGLPFANAGTPKNVAAYSVGKPGGVAGLGTFQDAATAVLGTNGTLPEVADYDDAFEAIEQNVDLFNLMVLPRADGQDETKRQPLWGSASAFCAKKRAFLIVDPPESWTTVDLAEAKVNDLRIGIETRNSAAYWPRLKIDDGSKTGKSIDPAGSIAGLMARIDANRGVWKAPAGLEATVRGVTGVDRRLTDPENGSINPKALNALRVFPAGVVAWGARTLVGFDGSGNIDDKYVPVRRTMLFIEESLYRGLAFAVFEPNDEQLWSQIRLAAGSFMNGLFRQGAFAGSKSSDAYKVFCDATTTTATDINLGIVNVVVAFAPLKPAEFVILTVKQLAGQVQV
jgi:hypothetical protein